jgi:hypothetical protein
VNQSGWSLNRLENPKKTGREYYLRIIKSDAESTRQFARPAQELRAVGIDDKNTIPSLDNS